MEKLNVQVSQSDKRGEITDLLEHETINAITLVTFKKGALRGNHFHKETTQWMYILSGKIKVASQIPGGKTVQATVGKGDFIVNVPNERHALLALEDSETIVFTKGPRGGKEYESDTFRMDTPLLSASDTVLPAPIMKKHIPVSQPFFDEKEAQYVNNALSQRAISGFYGNYLPEFESRFARYCDCACGVAVSSGTAALHLALAALDVGKDDEVLVSALTNMASFFAVLYQGAKPVPVDIEPDTFNMNPSLLESKITPRTKAILAVHLFGHPVDMDPVAAVAKAHNLYVIEDGAQAHGAMYKGKKVGSLGTVACFSLYANKIITTGEGGMLTTNDPALAEKARMLKNLAFGDGMKFMHKAVGFNYRMTNLQAALGCAQIEKIETIVESKRRIAELYAQQFQDIVSLQLPVEKPYARCVYWMYHVALRGRHAGRREQVMQELRERGIETREGFIPYNLQDIFINKGWTHPDACPRARDTAFNTFYLPSGPELTPEDLHYVADHVKRVLDKQN